MRLFRMRASVFACTSLIALLAANRALAQDPPPRIGPFVVDLHATIPRFPQDLQLAQSRDMPLAELHDRITAALVRRKVSFLLMPRSPWLLGCTRVDRCACHENT